LALLPGIASARRLSLPPTSNAHPSSIAKEPMRHWLNSGLEALSTVASHSAYGVYTDLSETQAMFSVTAAMAGEHSFHTGGDTRRR